MSRAQHELFIVDRLYIVYLTVSGIICVPLSSAFLGLVFRQLVIWIMVLLFTNQFAEFIMYAMCLEVKKYRQIRNNSNTVLLNCVKPRGPPFVRNFTDSEWPYSVKRPPELQISNDQVHAFHPFKTACSEFREKNNLSVIDY